MFQQQGGAQAAELLAHFAAFRRTGQCFPYRSHSSATTLSSSGGRNACSDGGAKRRAWRLHDQAMTCQGCGGAAPIPEESAGAANVSAHLGWLDTRGCGCAPQNRPGSRRAPSCSGASGVGALERRRGGLGKLDSGKSHCWWQERHGWGSGRRMGGSQDVWPHVIDDMGKSLHTGSDARNASAWFKCCMLAEQHKKGGSPYLRYYDSSDECAKP